MSPKAETEKKEKNGSKKFLRQKMSNIFPKISY
jgi:hypothetical protein